MSQPCHNTVHTFAILLGQLDVGAVLLQFLHARLAVVVVLEGERAQEGVLHIAIELEELLQALDELLKVHARHMILTKTIRRPLKHAITWGVGGRACWKIGS